LLSQHGPLGNSAAPKRCHTSLRLFEKLVYKLVRCASVAFYRCLSLGSAAGAPAGTLVALLLGPVILEPPLEKAASFPLYQMLRQTPKVRLVAKLREGYIVEAPPSLRVLFGETISIRQRTFISSPSAVPNLPDNFPSNPQVQGLGVSLARANI
ncbi:hypothetical protein BJ912DRAFT_1005314, partial [Pholiota molesta]